MQCLVIALAISGVAAFSVRLPLVSGTLGTLRARQLNPSDIPAQCQMQCSSIVTDLQTCTTNACVCTTQVASDYQTCLNCLADLLASENNPSSSSVTNAVDTFNNDCASVNPNLAPITTPSVVGPTAAGSATAVGSGSLTGTGSAFPTGTGRSGGPTSTFGGSSLGSLGGGGLSTGIGGGSGLSTGLGGGSGLSTGLGGGGGLTQTAATGSNLGIPTGSATATTAQHSGSGHNGASGRLVWVVASVVGAAAIYLC